MDVKTNILNIIILTPDILDPKDLHISQMLLATY